MVDFADPERRDGSDRDNEDPNAACEFMKFTTLANEANYQK